MSESSASVVIATSSIAPSELAIEPGVVVTIALGSGPSGSSATTVVSRLVGAADTPIAAPDPSAISRGATLLAQLSLLPSRELASYLDSNPDVVRQLLAAPPSVREVSGWYGSLAEGSKASILSAAPQLLGNLEGVPFSMRNFANRLSLQHTMSALEETLASDAGRASLDAADRQLHMLEGIQAALGSADSQPTRTLLSLDPDGQGKAAIVLGDLKTADYVSFLVPGMFFTVDGQMGDWTDAAARLYDEQVSWLELLTPEGEAPQSVATIAWLGYETPNLTNVGSAELAYEGRDLLAKAIDGLIESRGETVPYIAVLAHSYGSTAALMALTEYDFEVDALALVGSPGSTAQSVDELHVRNGNVFVGEAPWDPVPNSSYYGSDPGSPSYGAKPMGVGGGLDIITHQVLLGSTGHNEYFGAGTESMRNMALIGIGHGEFVSSGSDVLRAVGKSPSA